MYKKGENLLCIKDFHMQGGDRKFTKNHYYKITSVFDLTSESFYSGCYNLVNDSKVEHALSKETLNKYFRSNREEKLKRILNER